MRALLALPLLLAASTAFADHERVSLSASDVTQTLRPYTDKIEHCYMDHTTDVYGAGKLSIELTITRRGELKTTAIKTPGLSTKVGIAVSSCIVATLDGVSFPARRAQTTATLPYYFQRTAAVGAGPIESCWKAEGCPSAERTASHVKKRTRHARTGSRVGRHGSSARSRPSRVSVSR